MDMHLDEDWKMSLQTGEKNPLGLTCVFCANGDLIYVFSNYPFAPNAVAARQLPPSISELLLFEPIVPLRLTNQGFQALHASEWGKLTDPKESYVGLHTLSSAHESLPSQDQGDENENCSDSAEDDVLSESSIQGSNATGGDECDSSSGESVRG